MYRSLKLGINTMRKMLGISLLAVVTAAALGSCAPDPTAQLTPEESQVFITNHDPSVSFSNYRTFSLADSVYTLQNDREGVSTTPREMTFLSRVAENMSRKGFVRIPRGGKPDLGVNVVRISDSRVEAISNPYSWNNYWGGGFGGGFYYPPSYSFYQVTDNYWTVEIIDLKNVGQNERPKVIWNAQIKGDGIFEASAIVNIVDALFTQSTYLKAN